MNHISFSPFHNRLIKFQYDGRLFCGVVLDNTLFRNNSENHGYLMVNLRELKIWKDAKVKGDKSIIRSFMHKISIQKIINPEIIM